MNMDDFKELEQEALEAENGRFAALVAGDFQRLEQVLDNGLRYVHASGLVENKEEFLAQLRSGERRYVKLAPHQRSVRVVGDVVFTFGDADLEVKRQEKIIGHNIRYLAACRARPPYELLFWQSTKKPG
jgi:hypothetical protein